MMRVPEGWQRKSLSEVCQPESQVFPVDPNQTYKLMGVRWYGNGPHLHSEVSGNKLNTKTLNQVRGGQLTYNKMWVSKGAFGVVPPSHDGMFATAEYPTFNANSHVLDVEFLRHYMKQDSFRDAALARCRGTTSRARLNPKDFLLLEILLPPLPEQRRVAEILSSVDEAIAATQAVIEQTRTVKQGVLKRLLTKGIGHTRFKQTEIGEIPEAWKVVSLGEIADFVNGRGFKPHEWDKDGLPIIRIQNLNGGKDFNYYNGEYNPKIVVEKETLLFAWSGSRGSSFGPHIWRGPKGLLNYHTWKVVLVDEEMRDFAFYALSLITHKIEKDSHGASALVHMQKKNVVNYKIPLPPQDERRSICDAIISLEHSCRTQIEKLNALATTKSALMSDLLTGRKRVPMAELAAAE